MKPYYLIITLAGLVSFAAGKDAQTKSKPATHALNTSITICYSDSKSVFIIRPGTSQGAKLFSEPEIADTQISPNGDTVAYTRDITGKGKDVKRQVVVYELATSKSRRLMSVPGDNNYGPVWSPDGKWIAYRHYEPGGWKVGLVRADDSEHRIIGGNIDPENKNISLEPTWWNPDCKSLWMYDLDFFYQLDLQDNEVSRVPFNGMLKDVEQSSGYNFSMNETGTSLLFSALKEVSDVDAEGYPASLVFSRDMQSGKCMRLSPAAMQANSPAWLADGSFIFYGTGKSTGIYLLKPASNTPRLLVRGKFSNVSASRR